MTTQHHQWVTLGMMVAIVLVVVGYDLLMLKLCPMATFSRLVVAAERRVPVLWWLIWGALCVLAGHLKLPVE